MQLGQPVELCRETEDREQATAALDRGNVCARKVYPRETAGNAEWAGGHRKCRRLCASSTNPSGRR